MRKFTWILLSSVLLSSCIEGAQVDDKDDDDERSEGDSQGDCTDGEDNDDDGDIDCQDQGCQDKPACAPTVDTAEPDVDTDSDTDTDTDTDSDTDTDTDSDTDADTLPSYTGGYNVAPCDGGVSSTGYSVGDVAMDFQLMDQHGEYVRLSDFCENSVLLVAAAFW